MEELLVHLKLDLLSHQFHGQTEEGTPSNLSQDRDFFGRDLKEGHYTREGGVLTTQPVHVNILCCPLRTVKFMVTHTNT